MESSSSAADRGGGAGGAAAALLRWGLRGAGLRDRRSGPGLIDRRRPSSGARCCSYSRVYPPPSSRGLKSSTSQLNLSRL